MWIHSFIYLFIYLFIRLFIYLFISLIYIQIKYLFINRINKIDLFIQGIQHDVNYSVYNDTDSYEPFIQLLNETNETNETNENVSNVYIGFVYHSSDFQKVVPFFQFMKIEDSSNQSDAFSLFNNNLLTFFKTIIQNRNINLTIDLITCNVNNPDIIGKIHSIESELNIRIRYSVDKTGMLDGNWVLESDNVDIKDFYFTDLIDNWKEVLAAPASTDISTSIKNGTRVIEGLKWNGKKNRYSLTNDITWTDYLTNEYISLQNDESFYGNNYIITIGGTTNTYGILASGSISSTKHSPKIKYLNVVGNVISDTNTVGNGGIMRHSEIMIFKIKKCSFSGNTVDHGCGGIVAQNYNGYYTSPIRDFIISTCTYSGNLLGRTTGGMCGYYAGTGGKCIIRNCNSSGLGSGRGCGLICGSAAGSNSGLCIIHDCYSTGIISGNISGGITGDSTGYNGTCKIYNCYSTGSISGQEAGGITGFNCGGGIQGQTSKCYVYDCYSIGNISGLAAGGITGSYSGDGGFCSIDRCFSLGHIYGQYAGGIVGHSAGTWTQGNGDINGYCYISRCYSLGNIVGSYSGGITGDIAGAGVNGIYSGHCIITECYSTGDIYNNCGGIVGINSDSTCIISNCYSFGKLVGIIASSIVPVVGTSNAVISLCYGRTFDNLNIFNIKRLRYKIGDLNKYAWKKRSKKTNKYPILKAFRHSPWKKSKY